MAVTITFEKKHFLFAGIIIAIPFMLIAINSIFAATTMPAVGHSISELFVNGDLDLNGNKIINSGNITISTAGDGIVFPDGSVQSSAAVMTGTTFVSCSWYKNGCPTGLVNEASPATNSKTKNAKEYYGKIGWLSGYCYDDCTASSILDCCKNNVNPNTVSYTGNNEPYNYACGGNCLYCGQNCYGPDIIYYWCCPSP